jgi:hypothetical protein
MGVRAARLPKGPPKQTKVEAVCVDPVVDDVEVVRALHREHVAWADECGELDQLQESLWSTLARYREALLADGWSAEAVARFDAHAAALKSMQLVPPRPPQWTRTETTAEQRVIVEADRAGVTASKTIAKAMHGRVSKQTVNAVDQMRRSLRKRGLL